MTLRGPGLPPPAFVVRGVYVYLDPYCPDDGWLRYYGPLPSSPAFVVANPASAAEAMQRRLAAAYRPEGVP